MLKKILITLFFILTLASNSSAGVNARGELIGGHDASGNLSIDSTDNATKGNVSIQPSGGNVGVGITPTEKLHINGTARLEDLSATKLIATDSNKSLASTNQSDWIDGTTNQVTVTDDGDGTATLSTPQDIHTGASPTFSGLNLSGLTASQVVYTDASKNLISVDPASDLYSQYLLLAGRSGGQTAYGGTLTGNDLYLYSNTSKDGTIFLGDNVTVDDATGDTGVGGDLTVTGDTYTNLTQYSVPFIGASGLLDEDTDFVYKTGMLGVGTDNPELQIHAVSEAAVATRGILSAQHNDGAQSAIMRFKKSRGTEAAPTTMVDGDYIGVFQGFGYDGSAYQRVAQFGFRANGTVSAGNVPMDTVFFNSATTAAGFKESLRLVSDGNVHLSRDNHKLMFGAGTGTGAGDTAIYDDGTNLYIDTDNLSARPADLKIDCGTNKTIELVQPVYDDLQIVLGSTQFRGSSDPTWTSYRNSEVLAFSNGQDNEIAFTAQLSHRYKLGTNMDFHVHTTVPDNNSGVVRWILTYSWADIGSDFPSETTVTTEQTIVANSQDEHLYFELSDAISSASAEAGVSGVLLCNLTREGTHANDTYNNDIYLTAADFHFQIDTPGSRQETVK